jgi:hypothetical protein
MVPACIVQRDKTVTCVFFGHAIITEPESHILIAHLSLFFGHAIITEPESHILIAHLSLFFGHAIITEPESHILIAHLSLFFGHAIITEPESHIFDRSPVVVFFLFTSFSVSQKVQNSKTRN